MEKQDKINFWSIKHQIDDEIKRIGWTKEQAKEYIKTHYNKSTRLAMNDAQLIHLLSKLQLMDNPIVKQKTVFKSRRQRRRRCI